MMPAHSDPTDLFCINALSRSVFATDDVCVDSVLASSCPDAVDASGAQAATPEPPQWPLRLLPLIYPSKRRDRKSVV